jgi:hypothetical protein
MCYADFSVKTRALHKHTGGRVIANDLQITLPLRGGGQKRQNPAHMKTNTLYLVLISLLTCFAVLPTAQAVSPPPDGGYPNYTTAEGDLALRSLFTGVGNTAVGWASLFSLTSGSYNTGIGAGTLLSNIADSNTAIGAATLLSNTVGTENVAVGTDALAVNTTGNNNTANGAFALFGNTVGTDNVALGFNALDGLTSGSANTALGTNAGIAVHTANFVTCIGADVEGDDVNNSTWIGNVYGVTTQNAMTASVIVSADGQLGTIASSKRFKKDITTMEKASEAILSLRPVTFHYRTDTKCTPQFGLIAEEVAKVNPALVLPDKEGKP